MILLFICHLDEDINYYHHILHNLLRICIFFIRRHSLIKLSNRVDDIYHTWVDVKTNDEITNFFFLNRKS